MNLADLFNPDMSHIEDFGIVRFFTDAFHLVGSWIATLFSSESWSGTWEHMYLRFAEWFKWADINDPLD